MIRLTLACEDYDRTRALRDGRVQVEGVDLNFVAMPVEEAFWRMLQHEEFEASEMSLGAFLIDAARGRKSFVAIPVFPSRTFRHRCIFVNTGAGISRPQDLRGRRVGVPEYTMTAAVWLRGMLQHDYGMAPQDMVWVQGGVEQPGRKDRVAFEPPAGLRLETVHDRTLSQMLEGGEIDALISARMPSCFAQGSPRVARLFADFKQAEIDYFLRTRIFPPMHVIVLRRAFYERFPWVAQNLYKALLESKRLAIERINDSNVLFTSLPWTLAEYEEVRRLMGEDYWPYGFAENEQALETLQSYLWEQRLIPAKLDLKSLFAPSTLGEYKI